MSPPVWCVDLAVAFWRRAGPPPPFPRDLAAVTCWFDITVVPQPGLTVNRVAAWFVAQNTPIRLPEPDRALRGCLVAACGKGFAFLDPADDPAEQRFTLAHEVGHFLRDYWRPREVARTRLGADALAVLDGIRPPTPAERVNAVLRHASVGAFAHLLARDGGVPATDAEREAEAAADRLAFELLAPAAALGDHPTVGQLVDDFGLPPGPAARYLALLRPVDPPDRAWTRLIPRRKAR